MNVVESSRIFLLIFANISGFYFILAKSEIYLLSVANRVTTLVSALLPGNLKLDPKNIQIFGGKKMSKNTHLKIFQNFFQNHQVSLGVFLLGLFIGPERKGVSTWACTNAA